MKIGISNFPHSSPEEWAKKQRVLGCTAAVFPVDYTAPDKLIDAYKEAADRNGLVIAEVGTWCNPLSRTVEERKKNIRKCIENLKLADYLKAGCCVNIAGTTGEKWDGGYKENYSDEMFAMTVESVQNIIDEANPQNTYYTLEPMPYMLPWSPECYQKLLTAIDRPRFAVHMDAVNMVNTPEKYFNSDQFVHRCFSLLGPRIKACHVKDVLLVQELTFHLKEVPAGKGGFDIAAYAHAAEESSPDMPFLLEHVASYEDYEELIPYLRGLLDRERIQY